ncbi:ABC transporter transmembrane domain-containing protein [uncultured Parolsenella sp.]|uniref:ABC transporter ATP-binding protein n=1 Tax=uncultured Parolsenella sp. TaxID=2083008 RepID=UPI0027D9C00B|nr:ABC transporter transmembrane domain-containing protein [uncultured Parolsenella sp.]
MSDIRILLRYFGPYRKDFAVAALCVFIEGTLELIIPFLTASLIDEGVMAHDLSIVWVRGVQMLACGLVALAFGLGYARASARAAMGLGANLREAEYEQIQRFSFENLDHFETSSLVTRMTTDVTVIQNALTGGFRPMLRGPVMLVMGLLFASVMSLRLAAVFFVLLPILALALVTIIGRVAPRYAVLQRAMDELNEVVQEVLTAPRAIKAFVREEWACERFGAVNADLADTATGTFKLAVLNMPIFQAAMYSASVLIMWFGGQMILAGTLQVGELTGFMSYVLQITNSLMMISNVFLLMTRALTSVRRVGEVLDEAPTIESPANAIEEVPDGSIEFRDVSFRYAVGSGADVLSRVTLSFPAGSTVGVLGGTGSGKSSLVQLLPRLYDVSAGAVRVGGHDVRSYDVRALRDNVGIVLQKNVLFSGTVRDNLRWGAPNATDEELRKACRVACVDEFLDRIGGLDADLGQGGANVSGGQKQRLCIARTLLKHPRVLVFDDSTSACDMTTDAKIRAGLAELKDVTKVVIAQRVASVMDADQIVMLDEGRVSAVGTHDELLASNPIYQELYRTQMTVADDEEVAHDGE